ETGDITEEYARKQRLNQRWRDHSEHCDELLKTDNERDFCEDCGFEFNNQTDEIIRESYTGRYWPVGLSSDTAKVVANDDSPRGFVCGDDGCHELRPEAQSPVPQCDGCGQPYEPGSR